MKQPLKTHLKLNAWSLALGIAALALLELVAPYQGWVVLLVGLGGAFFIGCFWALALKGGLSVSREIRFGWAQVGDRLEERLILVNDAWVPGLWLEIIDHSTLPGYDMSCATGIDARSTNPRRAHGTCTQRGAFTLGPTTLRTGDPFGIITVTLESSSVEKMLVVPPVVALPSIEVASGGRAREGRRRTSTNETTVNASTVRDYSPGDSLHSIHWRTVARRDELFVRVLDGTPRGDWWIILDLNSHAQFGTGEHSTLEQGIIYAASLVARGIQNGHAVGLAALAEDPICLPPREGQLQRWEAMRSLALAQPGTGPLKELLRRTDPLTTRAASIIVITADTGGEWIEALLPYIWRGCVPTILLFDPISFGGLQDPRPIVSVLGDLEISPYVLRRAVLDQADTMPGDQGRLDWRVTPQGRAILSRPPGRPSWRSLT